MDKDRDVSVYDQWTQEGEGFENRMGSDVGHKQSIWCYLLKSCRFKMDFW